MAKAAENGGFGEFFQNSMDSWFNSAFPALGKVLDKASTFSKEEKEDEKKADNDNEDSGTPNKKKSGSRSSVANEMVIDALDSIHNEIKTSNIVLAASHEEYVRTNQLLNRILEGSGSGGAGIGGNPGNNNGGSSTADSLIEGYGLTKILGALSPLLRFLPGAAVMAGTVAATEYLDPKGNFGGLTSGVDDWAKNHLGFDPSNVKLFGPQDTSVLPTGTQSVSTPKASATPKLTNDEISKQIQGLTSEVEQKNKELNDIVIKEHGHLNENDRKRMSTEDRKDRAYILDLETKKAALIEMQTKQLAEQLEIQKDTNKDAKKHQDNVKSSVSTETDKTITDIKTDADKDEALAKAGSIDGSAIVSSTTPTLSSSAILSNAAAGARGFGVPLPQGESAESLGNSGKFGATTNAHPGGAKRTSSSGEFTNPIGDGHPGSEVGKMNGLEADKPEDRSKIDAYLKEGGVSGTSEGEAWCADWVNAQLAHEGIKGGNASVSSFNDWGTAEDGQRAKTGDVMVASNGTHVGRYTGNKRKDKNGNWEYELYAGNESIPNGPLNTTPGRQDKHNGYGRVNTRFVKEGEYKFRGMPSKDDNAAISSSKNPLPDNISGIENHTSFANEAGLPAGMRNNNPINIKYHTPNYWKGEIGPSENKDQGDPQVKFDSNEHGLEAASKQMSLYKTEKNISTIHDFFHTFTPGNPKAAVNIAKSLNVDENAKVDFDDPSFQKKFMRATITQEQGPSGAKYTDEMISNAIAAAHGKPLEKIRQAHEQSGHIVDQSNIQPQTIAPTTKALIDASIAEETKRRQAMLHRPQTNDSHPASSQPAQHFTQAPARSQENFSRRPTKNDKGNVGSASPPDSRLKELFASGTNSKQW